MLALACCARVHPKPDAEIWTVRAYDLGPPYDERNRRLYEHSTIELLHAGFVYKAECEFSLEVLPNGDGGNLKTKDCSGAIALVGQYLSSETGTHVEVSADRLILVIPEQNGRGHWRVNFKILAAQRERR